MEENMQTQLNMEATKKQDKKLLHRIRDFVHKPFSSIWFKQNPNTTSETQDFDSERGIISKCSACDIQSYDRLEVIVKDIEVEEEIIPHIFDIRSISELNVSINGGGDGTGKKQQENWPYDIIFLITDFDFLLNHPAMLKKLLNGSPNDASRFHIYMPYVVHKEFAEPCEHISDVKRIKLDSLRMFFLENLDKLRVESYNESGHQVLEVTSVNDAIINCLLKLKQINVKIILVTNNEHLRTKATGKNIKAIGINEIRQFFDCYESTSIDQE